MNLFNFVLKPLLYDLTDRKHKPPKYQRLWGFWGLVSFLFFAIANDTQEIRLLVLTSASLALWSLTLLAYIVWQIKRRVDFISFKKKTQVKDKPFKVSLLSSDKSLRPKDKGAG